MNVQECVVRCSILAAIFPLFQEVCFAESPATSTITSTPAPIHCQVAARLVEAIHEHSGSKSVSKSKVDSSQSDEETEQLKTLPYGSFKTLSVEKSELNLGQSGSLELTRKGKEKFVVKVTPHSFANNKVHYTVEWTAPGERSVVATRLGVENGRSIMLGTDEIDDSSPKDHCLIVGVKVHCDESK